MMGIYIVFVGGDLPWQVQHGKVIFAFPTAEAARAYRRVLWGRHR